MIYETIPEKFLFSERTLFAELYHSVHILNYLRDLCGKILDAGVSAEGELNDGKAVKLGQLINDMTAIKENLQDSCKKVFDVFGGDEIIDITYQFELYNYVQQQEEAMFDKWINFIWDNGEHNNVVRAFKNLIKRVNVINETFVEKFGGTTLKLATNGTLNLELVGP